MGDPLDAGLSIGQLGSTFAPARSRRYTAPQMAATKTPTRANGRSKAAARKQMKVCGAAKRSGAPCTLEAGWGTDHLGEGRCRHHTGMAGVVSTARKLGVPEAVTPTQAISGVLRLAVGNLAYVNAKVLELDGEDIWDPENRRWITWQERLMDRVAKYAATAVNMGVAERQVQLAEQQTRFMGELLEAVMGEIELTPEQRKRVGPAIRNQLAVIEGKSRELVIG